MYVLPYSPSKTEALETFTLLLIEEFKLNMYESVKVRPRKPPSNKISIGDTLKTKGRALCIGISPLRMSLSE